MSQIRLMKKLVDKELVSCLVIAEKMGWLKFSKKRDELIHHAVENGKTESAAWLLNFKNRTPDFAAERKKAEKKLMEELNAGPNSIHLRKQRIKERINSNEH